MPRDSTSVPSPCVSLCRIDPFEALCSGCFRSLDEIAAWSAYSDEDKRRVLAALAERRKEFKHILRPHFGRR